MTACITKAIQDFYGLRSKFTAVFAPPVKCMKLIQENIAVMNKAPAGGYSLDLLVISSPFKKQSWKAALTYMLKGRIRALLLVCTGGELRSFLSGGDTSKPLTISAKPKEKNKRDSDRERKLCEKRHKSVSALAFIFAHVWLHNMFAGLWSAFFHVPASHTRVCMWVR